MTDKSDSVKVGPLLKDCDVKIGQGIIAFKEGWSGRVKKEAHDILLERGAILADTDPELDLEPDDESGTTETPGDLSPETD